VPFAWTDVKAEPKNVAVLQQQELLAHIQCLPKVLDRAKVAQYVAALERIASTPPAARQQSRPAQSCSRQISVGQPLP
jgi:hypothetical protein